MRSTLVLLLVALPALAAASAETDVLAALDAWKQAALKGDATALGRLYHPDLAYTHSNAMTQTKAVAIASETAPNGVYKGIDIRDLNVHVYQDTAVLEYKLDLTHFAGDTAHLHEVMVWLKTPAGWQMLARHATKLPPAVPAVKCEALTAKSFGDDAKITSAALVPAKGNMPEHCDVRGTILPEAGFAIKLPSVWNERFEMLGNGGTAGTISMGAVDGAVRKGFAASSTDTGHEAAKEPLATFAYVTPENPNGHRKLIDFAYLAVHETAALSKRVIETYYGTAPKYSYWVGCSTGGRQGLQEAQRYPDDFDGLVIGAPGVSLTGNVTRRLWIGQANVGAGAIPAEKLPLLTKAIYEKCDALDGLKDGLIDDPRACHFDPARDVAKCAGADGTDCFTSAQIDALKKIYGGPRDSKGKQVFFGELPGSEPVWPDNFIPPSKTVLPRSESQMKLAMLNPPPGPSWDYTMFNLDTDPAKITEAAAMLNPQNPDLAPLKKRGGKIVQYAGWADQQVNPLPGIEYYGAVNKRLGESETRDFYRVFMVPGMFHCNGGPGCGSADWLSVVTDWVERGKAPAQVIGAHVEAGKTTRTRPLCPYPQVARYKGNGSIDDAANFSCVAP